MTQGKKNRDLSRRMQKVDNLTRTPEDEAKRLARNERQRKYRERTAAATDKKWREDNPERYAEYQKQYRQKNKKRLQEKRRERAAAEDDSWMTEA